MSLSNSLFRAARTARTVEAFSKGPGPAARRVKNIAVGRALARAGVWRRLWR